MARNMERSETTINPTLQSTPSSPQVPGLEFERFFSTEGVDPFDEVEWELRVAVIGNEKGEVVFEQRGVEIPQVLVAAGDQHRGLEVLPRADRHARARAQRQAADRPRRGHDHRRGRASSSTSRATSDLHGVQRRPEAPARLPEGGVQQPGLVQRAASRRRRSARPASSTRCRTRWSRSSAWPRPRACSSSSARAPARTCRTSARRRSCSPAAAPRRGRCRS